MPSMEYTLGSVNRRYRSFRQVPAFQIHSRLLHSFHTPGTGPFFVWKNQAKKQAYMSS